MKYSNTHILKIAILFLISLFVFNILAQVFIPFGYWSAKAALTVSPSGIIYMNPQATQTLTASGANGTYSWSITTPAFTDGAGAAGIGPSAAQTDTNDPLPVDYISRGTSYQNDTITVTSGSYTQNITVTTYDPLGLTPTSVTIAVSTTQQFNISNGYCSGVPGACTNATATWSVVSGGVSGSISSTGLFTATGTPGTVVIQGADSIGNSLTATITVSNTLSISPAALKIPVYSTMNYSAILGTSPYAYSVFSGGGSVGCSTMLNGALTATTTTITVLSTAGCPTNGVLYVESEQICYTGITATTFIGTAFAGTTVLRGCNGTTAAAHATGVAVNSNRTVYTAPSTTGSATVRVTDAATATSDPQ